MPPEVTPAAPVPTGGSSGVLTAPSQAIPGMTPGSTVSTIHDAVTGNSYSRDTAVPGSTYQLVPPTPSATNPTLPSSTPTDTTTADDTVAQGLGFKSYADALSQLTAPPSQSQTDLYNSAYSAAGLDGLANTIASRQNDLASATNNINNNPWLDEASRVGRVKNVTSLATADIKNYQTEYANKLKEVNNLVTQETKDQTANTTANKAKLAALEAQAKQLATEAKTSAAAPKTIKGASGATYKWNSATNSFDQILPGKAPTASSKLTPPTSDAISKIGGVMSTLTGPDGYISPVDWQNALNEWMAAGHTESTFATNFKSYANTKDKTQHYAGLP
jgi:hypothetical protein